MKIRKIDPKIKKIITMVKGKRVLAVINHIEKHGLVTTEDLEKMGYIHPPRAVRDVRENGVPIKTIRVKRKDGKSIAIVSQPQKRLTRLISSRSTPKNSNL